MKTVPPGELLEYRDGREGDVAPVRVERLPSGAVGVVVRYPAEALARARTRLVLAAALAVAFPVISLRLALWSQWFWIVPSLSQMLVIVTGVMLVLWWRAGWVYVFVVSRTGLSLETRGRVYGRKWECLREHVKDVRVHTDRSGHPMAMEIKSSHRGIRGMWFPDIGNQPIRDATAAIREGLGMEPA
jgi:hypothetical protein